MTFGTQREGETMRIYGLRGHTNTSHSHDFAKLDALQMAAPDPPKPTTPRAAPCTVEIKTEDAKA